MSIRWSSAIVGGVVLAVTICVLVLAGPVAGHRAAAGHPAATASRPVAATVKDLEVANAAGRRGPAVPIPCGQDETSWGYVGALRPGAEALARHALGRRLPAQVHDSATAHAA